MLSFRRHSLRGSVDWNRCFHSSFPPIIVTPFAGVWIEIRLLWSLGKSISVTPFAGVWIEISVSADGDTVPFVTPFAGVWIEIQQTTMSKVSRKLSLPSRECGLKFPNKIYPPAPRTVTPFAGVWIEIVMPVNKPLTILSLPSRECGLKFFGFFVLPGPLYSHSLRGSVDWNIGKAVDVFLLVGHSLRGSVDWNKFNCNLTALLFSHSLRGSVDWNYVIGNYV